VTSSACDFLFRDRVPTLRVNADGRLIEDEEVGSVEQAGADVEPSLHAPTVHASRRVH